MRFLRHLRTSRGPSWPFLLLSLESCYVCYSCDFCDICKWFSYIVFSQLFLLRQLRQKFAGKFLLTRSILDISANPVLFLGGGAQLKDYHFNYRTIFTALKWILQPPLMSHLNTNKPQSFFFFFAEYQFYPFPRSAPFRVWILSFFRKETKCVVFNTNDAYVTLLAIVFKLS